MEFGCDTLFYFSNTKPEAYAVFNIGNAKMDPDPLISKTNRGEVLSRLQQILWAGIINDDERNIYINFCYGLSTLRSHYVFNKITHEAVFILGNSFVNDLDGRLPFWPRYIYKDNILADQTDAFTLLKKINEMKNDSPPDKGSKISKQLELLGQQLTENSNPVLLILSQ
jgi:hypothetical protein